MRVFCNKKNILFIETAIGFGGAVVSLCSLLKGLNREKYNPIVVSSHRDEPTRRSIEEANAKFVYVKNYRRKKSIDNLIMKSARLGIGFKKVLLVLIFLAEGICRIPFFIRTLRITKRNNVRIIHLNNNISNNMEGIIIAKILRIPHVCHLRGSEYAPTEAKFISRYVNCFIAVSNHIKGGLLKLGVSQEKLRVIYNAVDIEECVQKSRTADEKELGQYDFGKYNVGLFSPLVWQKGHEVFIKAIDILVKEKNIRDCKFFIVGDVPNRQSQLREELMDLVNGLNLSEYIVFTGHQSNVYPFINKMDLVVYTSIEPEAFGRVIIEAMAFEKPVIATKLGGALEIIDDNVNGILIPPNDPLALAQTILYLLGNPKRIRQISEMAKQTVKERFSIQTYIREVEKIYEEVIQ